MTGRPTRRFRRRIAALTLVALTTGACAADEPAVGEPDDADASTEPAGTGGVDPTVTEPGDPVTSSVAGAATSAAPDPGSASPPRSDADDVVLTGRRWRLVAVDGAAPFGAPWYRFDEDGSVRASDPCVLGRAGGWVLADGTVTVAPAGDPAPTGPACDAGAPPAAPIVGTWTVEVDAGALTLTSSGGSRSSARRVDLADDLGDAAPEAQPASFDLVPATITSSDGAVCEVCLWLATADDERRRGLMGVTDLGPAVGMAFVYDRPQARSFVMRNTLVPLTIAFFGPDGGFVDRFEMTPCGNVTDDDPCPSYPTPVMQVAVEVFAGTAPGLGVGPGSTLELGDGPCPFQAAPSS